MSLWSARCLLAVASGVTRMLVVCAGGYYGPGLLVRGSEEDFMEGQALKSHPLSEYMPLRDSSRQPFSTSMSYEVKIPKAKDSIVTITNDGNRDRSSFPVFLISLNSRKLCLFVGLYVFC